MFIPLRQKQVLVSETIARLEAIVVLSKTHAIMA